jgi:Na+/proline symporter
MSGGVSIAASWIWAPALFVSVQVAYEKGLAGLFWFTVPNVAALLLFVVLGPRIRKLFPEGASLPQFIKQRFKSERLHKLYLFPYFFYQLMAVTVQLFAGGSLMSLLTGIPLVAVMPLLLAIALAYTLISGLRATVLTDVIQLAMIFGIGSLILPMAWKAGGAWDNVVEGFHGIEQVSGVFDPGVAFSFGVVTAIGLIAGAVSDQQYWQRSFAIEEKHLGKSFLLGGLLFALVPLGLSLLGFLAVNPELGIVLPEGVDASMIGVQTVVTLLPAWSAVLFVVMLLAGLSSTLDSALSAVSVLWTVDVAKEQNVKTARYAMVGIGVLGLLVAYAANAIPNFGLQHLWWIFNTIAACTLVPTVMSLYSNKLSEKSVFWGVLIAFVLGVPLFIYANLVGDPNWIVGSTLFVVGISGASCLVKSNFYELLTSKQSNK